MDSVKSPSNHSPLNQRGMRQSTNNRKYQSLKNINEPDTSATMPRHPSSLASRTKKPTGAYAPDMSQAFLNAARIRSSGLALHRGPSNRHKTPLSTMKSTAHAGMHHLYTSAGDAMQAQRGLSRQSLGSKLLANRDLSNADRLSQRNRLHLNAYSLKRKLITTAQVKELLMPVQRITASRAFGDKLEDYQELCKQLGDFKLSRVKANELNIAARGGAGVVQTHLSVAKKNAAAQASQQSLEKGRALTDSALKGKASASNLTPLVPAPGTADIESLVTSGSMPPVDLVRLVDWLNENQHSIQSKNHLRNSKNLLNVTQSTQLSEMKKIMTSDRYFLRGSKKGGLAGSGAETGADSYALDASSRMGGTGRLFQSRATSQMQNAAEAYGGRLRAAPRQGTASQMSESADELSSQGGAMDYNPYDHATGLSLPKLISKQMPPGADPREWQDTSGMLSRSQLSYGGVPLNQNHLDLMIQDGIQKQNMEMNSEITKAINILRKDPKLLQQVQGQLTIFQEDRIKKSYEDGVHATSVAKMRVREQIRRTNQEEEQGIENLIKQQTDAIHAKNLERLLTKGWSEHPNSYILLSKIKKFSKTEDRVNRLLQLDRYSP